MRKIIVGLFLVASSFLASAQQQQGTQLAQSGAAPASANADSSVSTRESRFDGATA